MNAKILSKENNVVKFTFQSTAEKFEEGLKYAYNKNKSKITIPGFRKGKAPRKIIEAQYGEGFFYDDAVNYVLNKEYESTLKELELEDEVVSRPQVDVPTVDKKEGITFNVTVTVKPEVTLGQYKGLEVEKIDVEVKDEDIDGEIKKVQEQNARTISVTDRPAQNGDITNISYLGTVDGVAFEGGQADSYDLTLGSNTFIPGFEDQIIGHNIGEKFDVNVTFPEEYHAKDLAGKEAVFAIELKDISVKELPEVNDEFAQDVSDFDTLDEYKASIVDKIKKDKEENAQRIKTDKLLDKIVENSTMDVPEIMYENKQDSLVRDFEENIRRQGLTLDIYCQYMGITKEAFRNNFRETAEKSVKAKLVLETIAKTENFVIEKEEFDKKLVEIGEGWGLPEGKIFEIFRDEDKKVLESDMLVQKAIDLIKDSSVEV